MEAWRLQKFLPDYKQTSHPFLQCIFCNVFVSVSSREVNASITMEKKTSGFLRTKYIGKCKCMCIHTCTVLDLLQ